MGVRTSPIKPPDQRPDWNALKPMPESRVSARKPIIIGHRGGRGIAPENTLASFQLAVDLGIDGVEFDVQRTKDGHLIVFHDENVERVTDGTGMVEDLTLDELKRLDVGRKFDERFAGERIPTLDEAFAFLKKTDLLLFLEMKEPWRYPGIEEQIVAAIRKFDLVERVQVRSFYHDALHTIFHTHPDIPLSSLWLDRLPTDDEVTFKTVNALYSLYTPGAIAHLHSRGQKATAWVVDDLDVAKLLIAEGIDGLTTDYPDQLVALVDGA